MGFPVRILVISNLFPPGAIGGYERGCAAFTEALSEHGHILRVLTSSYEARGAPSQPGVIRQLRLRNAECGLRDTETEVLPYWIREIWNQAILGLVFVTYRPNAVMMWNMRGLSLSLLNIARWRSIPLIFYLSDEWYSFWQAQHDPWIGYWQRKPRFLLSRIVKPFFRKVVDALWFATDPPDLGAAHFVFLSNFLKRSAVSHGKSVKNCYVIPRGLKISGYPFQKNRISGSETQILFVGRIQLEKGLHTAIEALAELRDIYGYRNLVLNVVGESTSLEYSELIQALITEKALEQQIIFRGQVPPSDMPAIYQSNDLLIFPSVGTEGFGTVLLEAMASGLGVVSTVTGGNEDLLIHEVNALTFGAGDSKECAQQVHRLLSDPELLTRLRQSARKIVENEFAFSTAVCKVEEVIERASKLGVVSRSGYVP